MTLSPSPLVRSLIQAQTGRIVSVSARLVPVPGDLAAVRVTDTGGVFASGDVAVIDHGNGRYTAPLHVQDGLPLGSHSGTFTVDLCKDPGCSARFDVTGGTLPYTITVVDRVTTTATAILTVGGAVQNDTGGEVDGTGARSYHVTVPSGQVLKIELVGAELFQFRSTGSGAAPNVVTLPSSSRSETSFRFSLSVPSDASETTTLHLTTTDAQAFNFHVTVTQ